MVFLNTFAEGACVGNPEEITSQQLRVIAPTWKRSQAIAHYRLFGVETVKLDGVKKTFLVGDIGSAKVMLPIDEAYSAVPTSENPERLLNYWISAIIEDYDFQDEANPILILNRKKALEVLQQLNARRIQPGGETYGVIQHETRGGYIMNVGGYPAMLPKAFYDWVSSQYGIIGEGFNVRIVSNDNGRLVVSRRDLVPNPFQSATARIRKGMRVRARITHMYRGLFKAEIRPGVPISISTSTMYRLLHEGDDVMVEVRGSNKREFYGVVVS